MTAADLAERLGARPTGPGRWMARCPSHNDRTPSLSLREGGGGKVLLRCFAGCDASAVLAAAGLGWTDVCGAPASPADRARLLAERRQREEKDKAERDRRTEQARLLRAADTALDALAARMAAMLWAGEPGDGDALAGQYHALLAASRRKEARHAA